MRALLLNYESRQLEAGDVPEPEPAAGQVGLRVIEAGVCGTDRELARFRFGYPPAGQTRMILGHEAVAEVLSPGGELSKGDLVVPMVRRRCQPACEQCAVGRRDLCITGQTPERGIFGLDGYFAEYATDFPDDLVRVPGSIADVAVLVEPLSVVEKALDRAAACHASGAPRSLLALGAGTIGILAALAGRVRGWDARVCSLEDDRDGKVKLLRKACIPYGQKAEPADIVVEATGDPEAVKFGLSMLAPLGVLVVLGAPEAEFKVPTLDLIVKNQTVLGSVNASPESFRKAVVDLGQIDKDILNGMISRRSFQTVDSQILTAPPGTAKLVYRV